MCVKQTDRQISQKQCISVGEMHLRISEQDHFGLRSTFKNRCNDFYIPSHLDLWTSNLLCQLIVSNVMFTLYLKFL